MTEIEAKENGFTWHDLRKNPNDVPKEEHTVILLTEVGVTTAQYDKKFESFFRMNEKYYFANGCIFDEETDNLVAFGWYEDALHDVSKYYKVVE